MAGSQLKKFLPIQDWFNARHAKTSYPLLSYVTGTKVFFFVMISIPHAYIQVNAETKQSGSKIHFVKETNPLLAVGSSHFASQNKEGK